MILLKNPSNNLIIQVSEFDLDLKIDWNQAKIKCHELGDGWRLPHENELEMMYKDLFLKGLGNFSESFYWSSSEGEMHDAWGLDFKTGSFINYVKHSSEWVRPVRYKHV